MRRFLALFVMLMLCGVFAFAQNRVVTGRVTNSDGNPVPFASVKVRGTPTGVAADANGVYSIRVKDGDILEISSQGMEASTVRIAASTSVADVQLRAASTVGLTEVVVTALGIKRQAKELGYSTTKVGSDELNAAKVTNASTGLAGKVAGLQVNLINNGVKAETKVLLRGNRSILGNNTALLVVDDIIMPMSYLATMNPNDIDNVNVLKGGAASVLYGSDASNGVVIVTTKKGTKGRPIIKVGSSIGFETIGYTPDFQNEFGPWGGETPFASYPGQVMIPGFPYNFYAPYENQNYGPRFNGQKVPIGAPIRIYRNDGTYFISQDSTYYAAKAYAKKAFFNQGTTFQNDVSYSGGDEKSKFYFSFQDANIKGVVPKDYARRDAIRANGSRENGIFGVQYNVGYTFTHANTTPGTNVPFSSTAGARGGFTGGGSYFQNRPLYWIVINQPAMADLRDYRNWQKNPYASPDGYFNAYYGNPWWQIDQSRLDERNNDLIANFALTVKPNSWLDLAYKVGVVRNDYSNKYTKAGYNFAQWAIDDTLHSGNIPSGVKVLSPSQGDAVSWSQRLTSDLLATFHKAHKDFDFKFIAGTSMQDIRSRILSTSASVLVIPDFYNISNRVGEPTVGESFSQLRKVGVYGELTVGYKNWLFLHGTARNDWTSVLAESNRSYFYPGVDLSFVFTDAIKSLNNNYFLSSGKLRLAWAKTGNVNVGPYSLANTFPAAGGFPFGGVAGFTLSNTLNNPNLTPEFITDKEIGLELAFLKNRVLLNVAAYQSNSTNQTLPISISPTTGFTSTIINTGEMENKGIEVELKVSPIVKSRSGIRWDVNANFSYNRNKIVSLIDGTKELFIGGDSYAIVGESFPSIKVSDWQRDDQGHIIVDKVTGYPTLATSQKLMGTATPKMRVGIGTSVSFKGFTFSALADGRFGAVINNAIGTSLDFTGVSAYSAQSGRQPFVIPGSVYWDGAKYVPNTNINTQDGNVNFWASTWNTAGSNYINSADFWKLREFSFAYNMPKKLLNGWVKGMNFQITGRNFFTHRAKENVWSDPEFSNNTSASGLNGNVAGTTGINELPPTKILTFSVGFTF